MPKYPEESLYNELKSSLSEDQLNLYKNRVEKYYGHLDIEFPWDEE